ncbi:hypothetical protein Tco_0431072 [Tanacetum coccineum]
MLVLGEADIKNFDKKESMKKAFQDMLHDWGINPTHAYYNGTRINADHVGCHDTRRSTSGSMRFLGDRLVSWSSKRKKSAAISSAEAEYIALSGCCAQVLWMRSQLTDYGLGFNKIPIFHFIKEQVKNGVVDLYFVNTEYQLTNIFSKALCREMINFLIDKLGMRSFTPEILKLLADKAEEYCIMDTTKAQQKVLDDALIAPKNHLKIGKCNQRLNPTLKSNEPTIQVALDALKLTPFYNTFVISNDVPEIYMQVFWATVKIHHFSLRFKMNGKSHTANVDNLRDMLMIYPKLPGQKFEDPPFKEEILPFIRDLRHTGEIKEDFVYQVENKNSKKNNDMYYLRFTKVIVDYFMEKDPSISRRNKMFWHNARDDSMFTTIRVISKHQDTQIYGAILPQHLTNQAMLEFESYKTYRAYATGKKTRKPKSTKKKGDSESSPMPKPTQASKGKRIKTTVKGDKAATRKQPIIRSKGLTVLSEVALTKAEQMEIILKRSKTQQHNSHKSSDDESEDDDANLSKDDDDVVDEDDDDTNDDTDDDEWTESDNDGDEFVHPKLTTHDDGEMTDEEEKEEDRNEVKMTDAQVNQDTGDAHVTLTAETQVVQQHSSSVSSGFISNMLNLNLDKDIDSILNVETTSLVDVPVTTQVMITPSFATTLPLPLNPLVISQQQTPVPIITNALIPSLENLPKFGFLFGFDTRLKTLEDNFSEFKQTNQYATALSLIPNIVNNYLGLKKLKDAVDVAVQLKYDKLREDAQTKNQDYINNLDAHMQKIIKEQVKAQVRKQVIKILPKNEQSVNDQLEAELLTRSSNEA